MRQKITKFSNLLGIDSIGFISYQQLDQSLQQVIQQIVTDFKAQTIVSIAFPYCFEPVDTLKKNGFSIYTKRPDYHFVVKSYLSQIAQYINSLGGQTQIFVDSNPLPERYLATLGGIGFIGKNQMLITPKYGSYVFLGEIITDLKIEVPFKKHLFEACGDCEICLKVCPTKAITTKGYDKAKCLSYLTQKKELDLEEEAVIKKSGVIFGCDFCQLKCPYNIKAVLSPLEAFQKLEIMEQEPEFYETMTNAFFKEHIKKTSCGWRGKKVITRNVHIKLKR